MLDDDLTDQSTCRSALWRNATHLLSNYPFLRAQPQQVQLCALACHIRSNYRCMLTGLPLSPLWATCHQRYFWTLMGQGCCWFPSATWSALCSEATTSRMAPAAARVNNPSPVLQLLPGSQQSSGVLLGLPLSPLALAVTRRMAPERGSLARCQAIVLGEAGQPGAPSSPVAFGPKTHGGQCPDLSFVHTAGLRPALEVCCSSQ